MAIHLEILCTYFANEILDTTVALPKVYSNALTSREQYFDCFNSSTNLTEMMKTRRFNMTVANAQKYVPRAMMFDGLQNGIACFCFSKELELDVCTTECGGSSKCGAWDTGLAAYNNLTSCQYVISNETYVDGNLDNVTCDICVYRCDTIPTTTQGSTESGSTHWTQNIPSDDGHQITQATPTTDKITGVSDKIEDSTTEEKIHWARHDLGGGITWLAIILIILSFLFGCFTVVGSMCMLRTYHSRKLLIEVRRRLKQTAIKREMMQRNMAEPSVLEVGPCDSVIQPTSLNMAESSLAEVGSCDSMIQPAPLLETSVILASEIPQYRPDTNVPTNIEQVHTTVTHNISQKTETSRNHETDIIQAMEYTESILDQCRNYKSMVDAQSDLANEKDVEMSPLTVGGSQIFDEKRQTGDKSPRDDDRSTSSPSSLQTQEEDGVGYNVGCVKDVQKSPPTVSGHQLVDDKTQADGTTSTDADSSISDPSSLLKKEQEDVGYNINYGKNIQIFELAVSNHQLDERQAVDTTSGDNES
ncbi:hypothetical protein BSL78_23916 [Apostichopus japonicus]|uniref:WSC domain-containing protein n=1 Tax=Stichopus japonicus TaxID=307972 RepID=A0A2G8JU05_STIJA|nr:hypothetical protein BSL78_23916 [Apostichopus japonicus]